MESYSNWIANSKYNGYRLELQKYPESIPEISIPEYGAEETLVGKILFLSDREGIAAIYIMNADGSNQTKLISNPNYSIEDFAVSPDGKRIAFSAIRPGVSGIPYFMLYIMNADGSNQTRLSDWNAYDPAWSPDGKKIAFSCANNIYLIDVESRNIIKYFIFQQCGWPTWSPDEKRLLSFQIRISISQIRMVET